MRGAHRGTAAVLRDRRRHAHRDVVRVHQVVRGLLNDTANEDTDRLPKLLLCKEICAESCDINVFSKLEIFAVSGGDSEQVNVEEMRRTE